MCRELKASWLTTATTISAMESWLVPNLNHNWAYLGERNITFWHTQVLVICARLTDSFIIKSWAKAPSYILHLVATASDQHHWWPNIRDEYWELEGQSISDNQHFLMSSPFWHSHLLLSFTTLMLSACDVSPLQLSYFPNPVFPLPALRATLSQGFLPISYSTPQFTLNNIKVYHPWLSFCLSPVLLVTNLNSNIFFTVYISFTLRINYACMVCGSMCLYTIL